jgi:hypothetical protein
MLFDKVTKEHILQGIKDFEEKGLPNEFGPSSTYDVVFEDKKYPPKAIMVYANYHAEGRKIERYFKGGIGTDCFNAFERNGFKVVKKQKTVMNENLLKLKQEFLAYWPIEKLQNMTLEEYTDTNRENSFCYWLEHITRDLGSIVGGSSYKFGIYKRNSSAEVKEESNRTTDGEYAWFKKYGEESKEDAFETVKSSILKIANAAQNNSLELIDAIDLGNAYKWKIAFLYGDYNCVNMFKLDALRIIASNLEIKYNNKTPISYFHKAILELKPQEEAYFTYCHALWKRYQERLIDVKKDFAKWLNKNTFESYRAYLGLTKKSIEEKLDEINDFFDDIDFFLIDPKNVNGLVSTILFMMSKKERIKNPDFIEYDSKNSNGIPKAVLGKNNYIKFLTEKFDYRAPNYWVFQGNPNIYDSSAALKAGYLKSWKVAAHKDKIQIGDQVILWQTGSQSGCYALAEVTSEVKVFEEETNEQQYYKNLTDSLPTERVTIRIIKNLVEDPILWSDIKDNPVFSELKAGNQGTNFSATEAEFNELLHLHTRKDIKYWLYSPGGNADHWDEFYDVNIMAIGWDKLGDLKRYKSKDEIRDALHRTNGDNKRKPNNVAANYEFVNTIQIGDVVIVKQGRGKLLGYGVVTSDYFYDEKRGSYKSCRNVDWKLKGIWDSGHSLALKTLTDITKNDSEHEGYDKYSDYLLGIMNRDDKLNLNSTIKESMKPTNQILYGPPGTGKTFYLKDQLFEKYTSRETSISLEQHFENVVSSCSWWQVIAIALLDLEKAKVSEIHAHRWVQKKASLSNSKTIRPTLWGQLQSHTIDTCEFVNVSSRQQPLIFNKTEDSYWEILEEEVKELVPELFDLKDSIENYNPDPDNSIKHYDFVTFHQSFAYEDFIEGIKPVLPENDEQATDLGYKIEDGVFKKLCVRAKNDPDNCYAIFIDEINRGNVSAIFGELITLIEVDKRQGTKNELSIKLPYSKTAFSVPSNLDIYGTMNTADRSVEALDTALRRRFEFKEMMPDYTVIESEEVKGLQLSEVLKTINDRIELLIDRDHTVGHSYFVNINSEQELANAFNNKIVPLLQEYFYGDYGKIGLVLGKGFVEKHKNDKVNFADFTYENANDFKTPTFVIKQVDSVSVVEAVRLLLGQEKEKEIE